MANDMVLTREAARAIMARNKKAWEAISETLYLLQNFPEDDQVHAILHKKTGQLYFYSQNGESLARVYASATDGKTGIGYKKIRQLTDDDFRDFVEECKEPKRLPGGTR